MALEWYQQTWCYHDKKPQALFITIAPAEWNILRAPPGAFLFCCAGASSSPCVAAVLAATLASAANVYAAALGCWFGMLGLIAGSRKAMSASIGLTPSVPDVARTVCSRP